MTSSIRIAVAIVLLSFAGVVFAAAAPPEEPTFDVWEYQIEGEYSVDQRDIERAVYPFLGPRKTIKDVEAAQNALESVFRDRGLGTVLVNIPEQDVEEGVVRLSIIEGRIERLKVSGSRYFSLGRIKSKVPSLAPGTLPDLPKVQQQLAKLNQATPDRVVTPVLRPARSPGMVDVELKVDDRLPVHGSVELNDQFTRDTTRTRLNASLRYDNLWQREHSLGISYQVSPQDPNEVQVFSGTYLFRPEIYDVLVAIYGLRSDSDVLTGTSAASVGVVGTGWVGGVRVVKTLPNVGKMFHNLTLGFDYKDFEDTIDPSGGSGFVTPINYTKFVAGWGGFYLRDSATVRFNIESNFGIRGIGNTEFEFENKRFQGKPNFAYLRANASLERDWLYGSQLFVEFAGQAAASPLISNEQFNLGGAATVRGYVDTQVLVDDAIRARLELRSPSWARWLDQPWLSDARMVFFTDGAHGRFIDPLPGQPEHVTLSSFGVGVRFDTAFGFNSSIDWAYPMSSNNQIRSGESRLHFSFAQEF